VTPAQRRAGPDVEPPWVRLIHAAVDGSMLAFALWTLLYGAALGYRLDAWTLGQVWLPLAVLVVAGCVTREALLVRRDTAPWAPVPDFRHRSRGWTVGRWVVLGLGLALAALTAALAFGAPLQDFRALWATGLAAAVLLGGFAVTHRAPGRTTDGAVGPAGSRTHAVAAAMTLGLAVFTMFVRNPNSDDIYYVNRAVWVAQHGTFALRDTIFSPGTFPSTYGLPVASIEGLLGSLAHLFGFGGATFGYLVAAPVFVVLAAWSLWRLVCSWAPRRLLLVFGVAILVSLWCATGTVGDFSYARIWQGKVLGVCLVVPLAWVYLTRLARATGSADRAWTMFLLLGLGVAFVGLSTTGVIMAPVMAGAVLLAALLLRRGGRVRLAAGGLLLAVGPVVAGLAVLLLTPQVRDVWQKTKPPAEAFLRVVGQDPWLVALAVVGLLVGPVLVRNREGRALAAAGAFTVFAVLTRGLFGLLDAYTGAGPIDYRLLLLVPAPLLAGMLLAAPLPPALPALVRWPTVAAATAGLVALVTLTGTPVWSGTVGAGLTRHPTWKAHLITLPDVRQVLALHPGPGPVLLPRGAMATLSLLTTRTFAVAPRRFYLHGLPPEAGQVIARKVLLRVVDPTAKGLPPLRRVQRALPALHVSLACDYTDHVEALALLEQAGYGTPVTVRNLTCLRPPTSYPRGG